VITALGAAQVTIRPRHPEVPAAVVITGAGNHQKGHPAAGIVRVPGMPG
jgi:hypothetical protein